MDTAVDGRGTTTILHVPLCTGTVALEGPKKQTKNLHPQNFKKCFFQAIPYNIISPQGPPYSVSGYKLSSFTICQNGTTHCHFLKKKIKGNSKTLRESNYHFHLCLPSPWGSTLKGKNLLLQEQILSFKSRPL